MMSLFTSTVVSITSMSEKFREASACLAISHMYVLYDYFAFVKIEMLRKEKKFI